MTTPSAPTRQLSGRFAQDVRADVLIEDMLLHKQLIVVSAIGLLLLLRQLVLA